MFRKLIFMNALGKSITFNDYGLYIALVIEGLGEIPVTNEVQKAPAQDGTTWLDAVFETRMITVEGVINTKKGMDEVYRLRAELASILNPKLGNGTLTYYAGGHSVRMLRKAQPYLPSFPQREGNTSPTDAKSFSSTASTHDLLITYTAPTAPTAPTNPTLSPTTFYSTVRCAWGSGGAGYNNNITGYYVKFYANGVLQWQGNVGNVLYKDFDTSGWGEGVQASFEVYAVGTYAPLNSGTVSKNGAYKNTKPNTPTSPTVPKTSFIPSETIRVSFTPASPTDPNSNLAGYEVAMQNAASQWYNGGAIVGTNASGAATYVDVDTTGWTQGLQWKFFVRGYDSFGVRGNWSAATVLVTMNTAPLDPTIGYPVAGSTVYNRTPRVLLTAAQTNDGTKHIAQVYAGRGAWLSTATDFSPATLFSCGVNDNLAGLRKLVFKTDMVTDFPLGSNTIKCRMYDSFLYSGEVTRQFNVAALVFTDANLQIANMKVRAVHITELQTAIGNLRAAYGLGAIAWKAVTPNVTKIGEVSIITQMQTAVQDIFNVINSWDAANATFDLSATWVTVTVTGGVSSLKLRQAIEQLRSILPTI